MKRTIFALALAGFARRAGRARVGADDRAGAAAAAEMVVRRPVRQIRRGAAAARLQDLPRGLLQLPFDEPARRSAIWPSRAVRASREAQVAADRRRIQDQGPRRPGQADRARRAGRPIISRRRSPTSSPPRRPTAAPRRPTCRRSPRRAPISAASPGSCSTSSRNIRSRGRTTSRAIVTGYKDPPPKGFKLPPGAHYNEYFPGHAIAMPPPLQPTGR